jgi:hypothetical protein
LRRGTRVDGTFGFESVSAVLEDPFPPGLDPATVRLPSVPRLRSDDDDAAHHRAYWQMHLWSTLDRYRRAYSDPGCTPTLQADYPRVADEASRLAQRATASHPIGPIDTVACHATLKELRAGATALEDTVVALRGVAKTGDPDGAAAARPTAHGAAGQDFFASASAPRTFEFRLGLRGARGLRRSRALAGGPDPVEARSD